MEDVTEREQLEAKLRDASEDTMLMALLTAATHVVVAMQTERYIVSDEARQTLATLQVMTQAISGEQIRRINPAMLTALQRMGAGERGEN